MELPHAQAPSSVCSRCPRAACVIELCVMQSYIEPLYTIRVDKNSVNSGHSHPPRWAIGGQNNTQNPNIRIYKIDEPPPSGRQFRGVRRSTNPPSEPGFVMCPPGRRFRRFVPSISESTNPPSRPLWRAFDEPPQVSPFGRYVDSTPSHRVPPPPRPSVRRRPPP